MGKLKTQGVKKVAGREKIFMSNEFLKYEGRVPEILRQKLPPMWVVVLPQREIDKFYQLVNSCGHVRRSDGKWDIFGVLRRGGLSIVTVKGVVNPDGNSGSGGIHSKGGDTYFTALGTIDNLPDYSDEICEALDGEFRSCGGGDGRRKEVVDFWTAYLKPYGDICRLVEQGKPVVLLSGRVTGGDTFSCLDIHSFPLIGPLAKNIYTRFWPELNLFIGADGHIRGVMPRLRQKAL